MKHTGSWFIGLLSFLPIGYFIFFFIFMFSTVFSAINHNQPPANLQILFPVLFTLHFSAMLLIMIMLIYYIYNVFHNPRVNKDQKALWAVVLFMGNMIAMPIYWYLYIKPRK